jgi:hypothetical protein
VVRSLDNHTFVGAGFLLSMRANSQQQVSPNSKIYINLRRTNLPIMKNIQHLAIKPISNSKLMEAHKIFG